MKDIFIHEKGICDSNKVGKGTRIWAFSHVLKGATIGNDCNICDMVYIENDVIIGDRVTVKCGVQLWDGIRVEDDVFIGPNASFANDLFPRSKKYPQKFLQTTLKKGCSIGANATILPGITVGMRSMIGAGSVVTMDVPPHAVVAGNPAKILRYNDTVKPLQNATITSSIASGDKILVTGARFFTMKKISDKRGSIAVAEILNELPFAPKRIFSVFNVPNEKVRGQHAHKKCKQLLICVNGSCNVVLDDGRNRQEFLLDSPDECLYIPPMVWGTQYNFSKDAVLLVMASEKYDENDYIRNHEKWLKCVIKRILE